MGLHLPVYGFHCWTAPAWCTALWVPFGPGLSSFQTGDGTSLVEVFHCVDMLFHRTALSAQRLFVQVIKTLRKSKAQPLLFPCFLSWSWRKTFSTDLSWLLLVPMLSSGEGTPTMYLVPCILRNGELQGAGTGVPAEALHSHSVRNQSYVLYSSFQLLVMPHQPVHPVHCGVRDPPLWQHFEMSIFYLSFSSSHLIFPFVIGRCKQFSWHNRETLNFVLVRWLDLFLGHLLPPHDIIGRSFLLALLCMPWPLWVWPCEFVLFRWRTARLQKYCDSAWLVSCYTLYPCFFIATVCTSALIGFQKLPVPWNSLPLNLSLSSGTSPAGFGAHCSLWSLTPGFVLLFPSHPFLGTTSPVLSQFSTTSIFRF